MHHHGNLSGRARDYYLVGGEPPRPGQRFSHRGQAEVLRRIAAQGRAGFYEGEVAEDMVTSLRAIGGVHTLEDFAGTLSDYSEPVSGHYKGVELVEHPPNGQGATAILLNHILAEFDIASMDPWGTLRAHIEAEATKLAYATRDRVIADPDHVSGLQEMLDPATGQSACGADRPARAMPCPPHPTESTHKETVYLTVVDRDRMAVSMIYSIFKDFGSGVASDGFGILFHNRGAGFRLDEGHPNEAGGGKRPMHTIIPAMLKEDGKVTMPFGVMGGQYQATGMRGSSRTLSISALNPQEAIDAPRCFHRIRAHEGRGRIFSDGAPGACRSGPQRRCPACRDRRRAGDPHACPTACWKADRTREGWLRPRILIAHPTPRRSIQLIFQRVAAFAELAEQIADIRVIHRLARLVGDQVLLGHIGHVVGVVVFGQQVIERLPLSRARTLGDRVVPFFGVGELGVDVEDDTTKGMLLVPDHLAEIVFRLSCQHINQPLFVC
jgi:hypothetical protein